MLSRVARISTASTILPFSIFDGMSAAEKVIAKSFLLDNDGSSIISEKNSKSFYDKFLSWSDIPPIYCLAYIDPWNAQHKGQEDVIAMFPLAVLPQSNSKRYIELKRLLKNKNPNIKLYAYQNVFEEVTSSGPGTEVMSDFDSLWYSRNGSAVTIDINSNRSYESKYRRLYDTRLEIWQHAFVEACSEIIKSYNYDGLFLDQCTVYRSIVTNSVEREELLIGIQKAISLVRDAHPTIELVANSNERWGCSYILMWRNSQIHLINSI